MDVVTKKAVCCRIFRNGLITRIRKYVFVVDLFHNDLTLVIIGKDVYLRLVW